MLFNVLNGKGTWDIVKGMSSSMWLGIIGICFNLHFMFTKLIGKSVVSFERYNWYCGDGSLSLKRGTWQQR